MTQLLRLVALSALFAACGPTVSKYTVQAQLDKESVNALHEWEKFGARFQQAGIRNVRPSIEALDQFAEAAGWTTYTDARACFAVISFQRKSIEYADGVSNQHEEVVDWSASKHELVTASGAKLMPAGPVELASADELVVQYDALENGTDRWVPVLERFDRKGAQVCFDTPTPLAKEKWVRWSYTLPNKTRSEFTFEIRR